MAVIHARARLAAAFIGLAASLSACVHKTEAPTLTGPSGLGISIDIAASPDVLTWDGVSQSRVVITARDSNGQAKSGLNLRVDVPIGTLSQRNVATDSSGQAVVFFTVPSPPGIPVQNTKVDIQVTPLPDSASGGGNFDNSTPRVVSIMLVPIGVVIGPPSTFVPSFTVPNLNVGDPGVFTAKVVDSSGNDVTNQVLLFQWNFGDGGSATGQTVTHTFTRVGTFPVTLTITDQFGHTNFATQSITIGQGQLPTATFVASPASPVVNQTINFNASGSTAAPGHTITTFDWTFGDGTGGSGAIVTHSYSQAGAYTVTLQVTDDAGRKSSLFTQSITVGLGNPQADFNFNPSAPKSGQQVTFDGSPSQAFGGATIVSYSWAFDDGTSGSGQTVVHSFSLPPGTTTKTFNVLLTVTDSQGRTGSTTKPVTVTQ